ncbi:MAG: class I SAM-dependent methyltransferase [Maricaulaceae bacterium]
MRITTLLTTATFALLTGCATVDTHGQPTLNTTSAANLEKLTTILDAKDPKVKARYNARHPAETLAFFEIEPGMTVVEALPGGGWYTKILSPYIGNKGTVIGVDYALDMWPEFGGFADEAFIEKKKTWPTDWVEGTKQWNTQAGANIQAFTFGNRNTDMDGKVDSVLFIRALHNLARFEDKGGFLTGAIADTFAMLKPGGTVGIVQHTAPENNDDAWANGSNGYLKQSAVITAFQTAGFELKAKSDINANPKDQPTTDDMVWRLPPTLGTSADNPELKAKMEAIGESNRMTLLFQKPM